MSFPYGVMVILYLIIEWGLWKQTVKNVIFDFMIDL